MRTTYVLDSSTINTIEDVRNVFELLQIGFAFGPEQQPSPEALAFLQKHFKQIPDATALVYE